MEVYKTTKSRGMSHSRTNSIKHLVFDILNSNKELLENTISTYRKASPGSVNDLVTFAQSMSLFSSQGARKPSKQVFTLLNELDLNLKHLQKRIEDPNLTNDNFFNTDLEKEMELFLELFPEWDIDKVLGQGAYGIVYSAVEPITRVPLFAIKKTELNLNPAAYYYAVIKVFKLVDHPNIVRYYGCEIIDNFIYLFMEYCNQGSLQELIYDSPEAIDPNGKGPGIHSPELLRIYIKQTLQALEYLHSHDVVHRDLKPANLLISNGVIKLADFGAAKLWYKHGKESDQNNMSGSPCYLAPEVITDTQEAGPKGARDIWAVGCLLFEMVLGKEPWYQLDNIWSLYYLMGVWASRTRDFKTETKHDAPFQMISGCRVCDDFESDDESQFSFEGDDEDSDDAGCVDGDEFLSSGVKRMNKLGEQLMADVGCGIMDVNCINTATDVTNPLITLAVRSKRFSPEALDFLNLTLQWTPENRPTAGELLLHPFVREPAAVI